MQSSIEVAVFTSDIERKFHKLFDIDNNYAWSKFHVFDSIQNALSKITQNSGTLKSKYNVTLKLDFYDDQCSANHGTDVAVELHYLDDDRNPNIYLGSTCDKLLEILSTMASTWNIPIVGVGARSDVFLSGRSEVRTEPFNSDAKMTLTRIGLL